MLRRITEDYFQNLNSLLREKPHRRKKLSEVGFEPTPTNVDQNPLPRQWRKGQSTLSLAL